MSKNNEQTDQLPTDNNSAVDPKPADLVQSTSTVTIAQPVISSDDGTAKVTVESISSSQTEQVEDARMVKVTATYPKDWQGDRHLVEGRTYPMSPETADMLVSKGLAKRGKK